MRPEMEILRADGPQANRAVGRAVNKSMRVCPGALALAGALCVFAASSAFAQDPVYFVTYTHNLEEPRDLEVEIESTTGFPKANNPSYTAPWLALEYGMTRWWTAELYFEGVTTQHDGSGFTGWRWENRFRPMKGEHRVNPVLYIEYESLNAASRIQTEIVGSGALSFEPIADLRQTPAHELEGKLILSSVARGWNVSENVIIEKNLSEAEGLEFGYSVGVSRSLGGRASGTTCHRCRENFVAGVEAYGGLGSTKTSGLHDTQHYIAPLLGWQVTHRSMLKVSPGVGVTNASDRYLLRLGWIYEF
jgi:hypothetical protein